MNKIFLTSLILFTPLFVSAQRISDIINWGIYPILKMIPGILIGVAFIVFVWGIIKYILAKGEHDVKESVGVITFGIIALTVIIGVWGIVSFLQWNFRIDNPIAPGSSDPILNDIMINN